MKLYQAIGTVDYIDRSFRDVADQDYIAARMHYRYGLGSQFFWSTLQCMEKYFKAILLYNRRSARNLGHNIVKAFHRVLSISDIPFGFPPGFEKFVSHINEEGPNRYFEYPAVATGDELLHLDGAVWYIRRYCYYIRGELPSKAGGIDRFPLEVARVRSLSKGPPHRVRIWGGYLESVLDQGPEALRDHLVWKNPLFGRRSKKVLKEYKFRSWSANPMTFLSPEVYVELRGLIDFSPNVRRELEARVRRWRSTTAMRASKATIVPV